METEHLYIENIEDIHLPTLHPLYLSDHVQAFNVFFKPSLVEYIQQIHKDEDIQYAIVLKETDLPIGTITLSKDVLRYHNKSITISYWLAKEKAKKGYMFEALDTLIDFIFNETSYEMISARVFTENIASMTLLEKLGFQEEGCLKKAYLKDNQYLDEYLYIIEKPSEDGLKD